MLGTCINRLVVSCDTGLCEGMKMFLNILTFSVGYSKGGIKRSENNGSQRVHFCFPSTANVGTGCPRNLHMCSFKSQRQEDSHQSYHSGPCSTSKPSQQSTKDLGLHLVQTLHFKSNKLKLDFQPHENREHICLVLHCVPIGWHMTIYFFSKYCMRAGNNTWLSLKSANGEQSQN